MEIKMLECPNGHFYNAAVHAACPECGKSAVNAAPTPVHTPNAAPNQNMGNFPKTMPPNVPGNAQNAYVGHTMPVDQRATPGAGPATPFSVPTVAGGNLASDNQLEPVVGWLVCIEGPLRGVDFRIHDGYNYIGREEGDIHIHGDNQISRHKHAVISFYAKKNTFHVGPADGRNIIELNGEPVYSPTEIKSYDVLTVGSTKLMMVALCSERFSWTEGVANE